MDITPVLGLVFMDALTGSEYGIICTAETAGMHLTCSPGGDILAEDECGNAFLLTNMGRIVFWDHETDELTTIANSWADFVRGCAQPRSVDLDPDQVLSVWIDPAFAKQSGLEVPPDGWVKRPLD